MARGVHRCSLSSSAPSLNPGLEPHQALSACRRFCYSNGFTLYTRGRCRAPKKEASTPKRQGATLRNRETNRQGRDWKTFARHCHRPKSRVGLPLSYGADGRKLRGVNAQNLNSSSSLQSVLQPQRQVLKIRILILLPSTVLRGFSGSIVWRTRKFLGSGIVGAGPGRRRGGRKAP